MRPNDAPLLLDVTRLVWRRWEGRRMTGVDRVCLAYLQHFGPLAQAVVQHRRFRAILDRQASTALFDLLAQPSSGFAKRLLAGILRHFRGPGGNGRRRLYLNVGHTGLDSDAFVSWTRKAEVRPVYFVHDLIPITHPEFCRDGEDERHRKRMCAVLTTGCGIIANSQFTVDGLREFARAESLPNPPAIAAWLGTTPFDSERSDAEEPDRPTFVALGTIEARKNHLLLLEIWCRLVSRLGSDSPRLLIIGDRGWKAEPVFKMLDSNRLRGHVVEVNNCSDEVLKTHLGSARALLFPSRVEGFGLPLIEALSLGVPVIASDLPVFREIGRGVPDLIDSNDDYAWEAAILDYTNPGSPRRTSQLAKLQTYRPPDWDAHFSIVEKWLAKLGRTDF